VAKKNTSAKSNYVDEVRADALNNLSLQMDELNAYAAAVKAAGGDYFAKAALDKLSPTARAELGKAMWAAVQARMKDVKAVHDKLRKR
jgi:hypothetical protein